VAELAAGGHLAESCFELAVFEYEDLVPDPYRARLDAMAELVEGRGYLALRRVVAIREGYGGTIDDYDDPVNSFLHEVLDRRAGLPITLGAIWIEVGRRAGLEVEGVGLPGHFLVYAEGQLVDPFHGGEAIGSDEAASLVAETIGGPPRLNPDWLEPVSDVEIVERTLRNLHQAYRLRGESHHRPWIGACLEALGITSGVR
jgi:regulator of sirC expression with transglutaminase-like and TPR domain